MKTAFGDWTRNLDTASETEICFRQSTGSLTCIIGACISASTLKSFLKETTAMLSTHKSKRRAVLLAVGVLFTASLSLGVYSAKNQQSTSQKQNPPTKEWLFSIPAVRSKLKELEVVNVRIVRSNTDMPGVAFDILNKGGRSVMAIRISCGNNAISQDGLEDQEHPKVIIEPYGTLSAEMTGELKPHAPIVIRSATFQDGKEEGDPTSLEIMRKIRETKRAERGMRPAERNSNK